MGGLLKIFSPLLATFDRLGRSGFFVSLLLLVVISLFLVPLPPILLDLLLVINIVVALVLLLRSLYMSEPSALYAFPTILLMTTLFRLALNVSSTRLILLGGKDSLAAAGSVIESFGTFVVKGNFGVGAIIFAVIAIVNFVVIAKGSARVAEVSARFALDSLPGRQLAIDSDLRAETITREQAEFRREELRRESQFFGSMDGAMKFVQGDAIAGFVITFINLIGGVAIGISSGMEFPDAINTFGLLTIGDGLVGIIPSLLISVCAGIIVTHVGGSNSQSSGSQVFQQLLGDPGALVMAGLVLILLGIIPGFPFIPFFAVGLSVLLLGSMAWGFLGGASHNSPVKVRLNNLQTPTAQLGSGFGTGLPVTPSQNITPSLEYFRLKPLVVGMSSSNLSGAGKFLEEDFARYFNLLRDRVYKTKGLLVPEVSFVEGSTLGEGDFSLVLRERNIKNISLNEDYHFVSLSPGQLGTLGIRATNHQAHPLNCSGSSWIESTDVAEATLERLGVELINPSQYLALEVIGAAISNIDSIFGLSEVSRLVEISKATDSRLVAEIFDGEVVSVAEFSDLLRKLARENLSVRDIKQIMEGVLEYHSRTPETEDRQDWLAGLHEHLRLILVGSLVGEMNGEKDFFAFGLSAEVEDEFRSAVSMWDSPRSRLPLDPDISRGIKRSSSLLFAPVLERGSSPVVVLCPGEIRLAVQEYFVSQYDSAVWFRTVAHEELDERFDAQLVGVINA